MKREKHIAYNRFLEAYVNDEIEKFRKFKDSSEIGFHEKRLLMAREFFMEQKWENAIELLEKITPQDDFLLAEKHMLIGSALLFSSHYQKSIVEFHISEKAYAVIGDQFGQYVSNYNLSCGYSQLGLEDLAFFYVEKTLPFCADEEQELNIKRALAVYNAKVGKICEALSILEEVGPETLSKSKTEHLAFKFIAGEIYFRAGKVEKAFACLEHIMSSKLAWNSSEVSFEYFLIRSFKNNESIGAMPESVKGHRELELKWNMIRAIESGEAEEAKKIWGQLQEIAPSVYGNNFEYHDRHLDNTIFMTVLKSKFNSYKSESKEYNIKSKKLQSLYNILANTNAPIRKEDLIEQIWKVEYCQTLDSRFYQLVRRLRGIVSDEIINKNNAYSIVEKVA